MIRLTAHAIEQFATRFRRGTHPRVVRDELEAIAASAAPTKRRTPSGDATIWVATTSEGEPIALFVRDNTVTAVAGASPSIARQAATVAALSSRSDMKYSPTSTSVATYVWPSAAGSSAGTHPPHTLAVTGRVRSSPVCFAVLGLPWEAP